MRMPFGILLLLLRSWKCVALAWLILSNNKTLTTCTPEKGCDRNVGNMDLDWRVYISFCSDLRRALPPPPIFMCISVYDGAVNCWIGTS